MTDDAGRTNPEQNPDLTLDDVAEGGDGTLDELTGQGEPPSPDLPRPDDIAPELAEPGGDPGNLSGVHDRAGDEEDVS